MPKKRKHTPIVPVKPAEAPPARGVSDRVARKKPKKPKREAEGGARAVLWLHGTLRVHDNLILTRAAELGVASMAFARGLALVGCSVPSLVLSCKFLWDFRQQPTIAFYSTAPLPTVPLVLSHSRPVYDLGALALALAAVHWFVARSVRRAGAKSI